MKRVIAASLLPALASCFHPSRIVLDGPVRRLGDGWELTLDHVKDGPNMIDVGKISYFPAQGQRFLWVRITLHNPAPVPRKFSFDRCDLDLREEYVVPLEIGVTWLGNTTSGGAAREPELAANETITRLLVFSYPEDRSPRQFRCLPMTIAMPHF
jgi:hypothetical protein